MIQYNFCKNESEFSWPSVREESFFSSQFYLLWPEVGSSVFFLTPIYQLLVLIFMYLYPGQIYALGVVCAASFTAVKTCF